MVNKPYIKQMVHKAIYTAPIEITTYRRERVSDGRGGTIDRGEKKVGTFTALFDNTNASPISLVTSDVLKNRVKPNPMLYVEYEEFQDFRHNDYFVIGNTEYRISNIEDTLGLEILWLIGVESSGVEAHGES